MSQILADVLKIAILATLIAVLAITGNGRLAELALAGALGSMAPGIGASILPKAKAAGTVLVIVALGGAAVACGPSARQVGLNAAFTTISATQAAVDAYDAKVVTDILDDLKAACSSPEDASPTCAAAKVSAADAWSSYAPNRAKAVAALSSAWLMWKRAKREKEVTVDAVVRAANDAHLAYQAIIRAGDR